MGDHRRVLEFRLRGRRWSDFTDDIASAIEAAGPYRCRTQIWGLHNYAIEAIDEEVAPEEWVRVAKFDGYTLPPWASLPQPVHDVLVALNDGQPPAWRIWASHSRDGVRPGRSDLPGRTWPRTTPRGGACSPAGAESDSSVAPTTTARADSSAIEEE